MHMFIERGMRGGICVAIKKRYKANNKYGKDYDPNKITTEIVYIDMNNLYSKAMMSYLPCGGFRWIKVTDKNIHKAINKKDNSSNCYFPEVDMYYPDELQNYQNHFPMPPDRNNKII